MLDVIELECLGEGCTKQCYQHPDDATRVIKIIKSGYTSQQAGRYQIRMQREIKTLHQVRSIPELASYFPAYHGEIMTSAGIGYVFDKVDHLVDIFKKQYRLSGDLYRELVAIIRLLIQHDVPFCSDLVRNVFINQLTQRLYILDGLGCKYFIPTSMSPFPRCVRRYTMSRMVKKHIIRDLKLARQFPSVHRKAR